MPAPSTATVALFFIPIPVGAPTISQAVTVRTLSARDQRPQDQPDQLIGGVPNSADAATNTGHAAIAAAAMTSAKRRPPNSAPSAAADPMHPAWAAMASNRRGGTPPGNAAAARASTGVNSGWSTYPRLGADHR